jgi:hypothetical protein
LRPFRDETALTGINEASNKYYTKELHQKGTGMMAKVKFERADRITANTPVLIVSTEKILPARQGERILRRAIDQLPSDTRAAYLDLATMFDDPSVIVQDILKSNTFEIQVGGKMHLAVFPEPSRLNHDCAPKYVDLPIEWKRY